MEVKILIFVILLSQNSLAQYEILNCDFIIRDGNYSCELKIYNPSGQNNFQRINGSHLNGKTDDDVLTINVKLESFTINAPSIICETFKNVRQFFFRQIGLQRIDENSFKACKALTHLFIEMNSIAEIHENAFKDNSELNLLYLGYNRLSKLPENVFMSQQKLTTLYLEDNEFSDFPDKLFHPLQSLRMLTLERNQISVIKSEWFEKLASLEYLYLFANKIEELPVNVFSSLLKITGLYLFYNNLSVIHSNSFSFHPELGDVYLYDNQIKAIDERFIDNTGVKLINLERNLCADKSIRDPTVSREAMRAVLKTCFENYKNLFPGT